MIDMVVKDKADLTWMHHDGLTRAPFLHLLCHSGTECLDTGGHVWFFEENGSVLFVFVLFE